MPADLALGFLRQSVGIVLLFGCESVRVERALLVVIVLHEFQGDLVRHYRKRLLTAIVYGQLQGEYWLRAVPHFLQFLRIHGQDDSKIGSPETISILAVVAPAEGATRLTLCPA